MARYDYPGARNIVERSERIDLTQLKRGGYFNGFSEILSWSTAYGEKTGAIRIEINTRSENPNIRLSYRTKGYEEQTWKDMDYSFKMQSLNCKFGGKKWFFICGLYKNGLCCGRRVRILYQVGKYYGCRKCANLSYASCNANKLFRKGYYKIFYNNEIADEYYPKNVKRQFYRGKPTRKYTRYLKLSANPSGKNIGQIMEELLVRR